MDKAYLANQLSTNYNKKVIPRYVISKAENVMLMHDLVLQYLSRLKNTLNSVLFNNFVLTASLQLKYRS